MRLPYEDPGTPDLRGPMHLLGWIGRGQWRTLAVATVFGVLWMVTQAFFPAAMARAIDGGIVARDNRTLLLWCGVLVVLGIVSALAGTFRHYFAVHNWLRATFRSVQLIGWHSADVGAALPRTTPTGDVVATVASDAMRLGGLYDVFARMVGAVVSYVVVAVVLLSTSRTLGLVVLIGVPVLVALLSFVVRPLQKRQAHQREESGQLISLGADTVAGLRGRAHLPAPVCRSVPAGASGRLPGGRGAGSPRRGPGAAARGVRPGRDVARRPSGAGR